MSKLEQLCVAVLQCVCVCVCITDRMMAWFHIKQVAVQTGLPNARLTQAGRCDSMNHDTVLISKQSDPTDMAASSAERGCQVAEFFH